MMFRGWKWVLYVGEVRGVPGGMRSFVWVYVCVCVREGEKQVFLVYVLYAGDFYSCK